MFLKHDHLFHHQYKIDILGLLSFSLIMINFKNKQNVMEGQSQNMNILTFTKFLSLMHAHFFHHQFKNYILGLERQPTYFNEFKKNM